LVVNRTGNPVKSGGLGRVMMIISMIALVSGCAPIRPPKNVDPVIRTMQVTGYCKCGECCNWKRNWYGRAVVAKGADAGQPKAVGITASGKRARVGTIAADTTLYPFGTIMYIDGYGYGRVEDRGGKIKGNHIDLFFTTHDEALKWGKQTLKVKIWLPSNGE
jgi:3D (Asp-Asp-Asp) domain-containing protein